MPNYIDLDMFGALTENGDLKEVSSKESINQALIMFLTSSRGEYLKSPSEGGYLNKQLFKKMTTDNYELLAFEIQNGIAKDFFPAISLDSDGVRINSDANKRLTTVDVFYFLNETGEKNKATLYLNVANPNLDNNKYATQKVDYVDDNLLIFVVETKPKMGVDKLTYNLDTGLWEWGRFVFTNFSTGSSNFSQILNLING